MPCASYDPASGVCQDYGPPASGGYTTPATWLGWTQATQDGGATDSGVGSDPCAGLGFIGGLDQGCYDATQQAGYDQRTSLGLCCKGVKMLPTPTNPTDKCIQDACLNLGEPAYSICVNQCRGTGSPYLPIPSFPTLPGLNKTLLLAIGAGVIAILLLGKVERL